jgi:hypothetical protein
LAQETENSYSDEEYWSEPKEDWCLARIPINMQNDASCRKKFLHALSCDDLDAFLGIAGYRGWCFCPMSMWMNEWRQIHDLGYIVDENNHCGRVFNSSNALLSHLASKARSDHYHHDAHKYIRRAFIH